MKTLRPALLAVSLFALLPACTSTQEAQTAATITAAANVVSADTSLLPAAFVSQVKAVVAKHPAALPYLESFANGLESISAVGAKLPSPNSVGFTLVEWGGSQIPTVGAFVIDFADAYKAIYPSLAPTSKAAVQIAELLRSLQPPAKSPV